MTDKEREKLEDFIIAILLNKADIRKEREGRYLFFQLKKNRKSIILDDYIKRYNLMNFIIYNEKKLTGYVRPSLMLESVLRIWTENGKVHIIDPISLRFGAYYMWIALFAERTPNGTIIIQSELEHQVQYTLSILFKEQFGVNLIPGNPLRITPFSPILIGSVKYNRPIKESMELSHLLPDKEREQLQNLITEWSKEREHYAL